jgi:hypothetical protein
MRHRRRASERGLTLVEILMSLLILALGILGIMALFPTALQTSQDTVDQRYCANLVESIKHAIDTAVRFQYPAGTGDVVASSAGAEDGKVIMTHDLWGYTTFPYLFIPPKLEDAALSEPKGWRRHPPAASTDECLGTKLALVSGEFPNPELSPQFYLVQDDWLRADMKYIRDPVTGNDFSESSDSYAFNFDIAKVFTLAHMVNYTNPATGSNWTVAQLDPLIKLYEGRIYLHRIKGGVVRPKTYPNTAEKRFVLGATFRVALK